MFSNIIAVLVAATCGCLFGWGLHSLRATKERASQLKSWQANAAAAEARSLREIAQLREELENVHTRTVANFGANSVEAEHSNELRQLVAALEDRLEEQSRQTEDLHSRLGERERDLKGVRTTLEQVHKLNLRLRQQRAA
jgi:flagellar biosynthesis chaperone FliJ